MGSADQSGRDPEDRVWGPIGNLARGIVRLHSARESLGTLSTLSKSVMKSSSYGTK